jgi:hypothetical protein
MDARALTDPSEDGDDPYSAGEYSGEESEVEGYVDKNASKKGCLNICRVVTFLILGILCCAASYAGFKMSGQWLNEQPWRQGFANSPGQTETLLFASVCFGLSVAAFLTWFCSYFIRKLCSIPSGLPGELYNCIPRACILMFYVFFSAAIGLFVFWNMVITSDTHGLGQPIAVSAIVMVISMAVGFCPGATCTKWWQGLYVFFFFTNLIIWPIVLRYTMWAPVNALQWNDKYPAFPFNDWAYMKQYPQGDPNPSMAMSAVPNQPRSCNFTCKKSKGQEQMAEMAFQVSLSINQSDIFKNTNSLVLYPVLMMSSDFTNWHVAADRTDTEPKDFFRAVSAASGQLYRAVIPSGMTMFEKAQILASINMTSTTTVAGPLQQLAKTVDPDSPLVTIGGGYYLAACVVTSEAKLKLHDSAKTDTSDKLYNTSDLAVMCDHIGGVCGYPCGQIAQQELPNCIGLESLNGDENRLTNDNNGIIDPAALMTGVETPANKTAGANATTTAPSNVYNAEDVKIFIRQCEQMKVGKVQTEALEKCTPTESPMSRWTCPPLGLPPFEVAIRGLQQRSNQQLKPKVFMFISTTAALNASDKKAAAAHAAADVGSMWSRYTRQAVTGAEEVSTTGVAMTFIRDNEVKFVANKCMGKAGPLYMVGCAVNASQYDTPWGSMARPWTGKFLSGQEVAPPPFNDRCVSLVGRCGLACQRWDQAIATDSTLQKYCNISTGYINPRYLSDLIKLQTNSNNEHYGFFVKIMVFILLLGYYQRVLAGLPGVFSVFPQSRQYNEKMTDDYKYIAICTPSAGEDRVCTMRNIVGTTSTYPDKCMCAYHIVLLDEGHRHSFKGLFIAYVRALQSVLRLPEVVNDPTKFEEFMEAWVRDTRGLRLDDQTTLFDKVEDSINKKWDKLKETMPAMELAQKRREEIEVEKRKWKYGEGANEMSGEAFVDRASGVKAFRTVFNASKDESRKKDTTQAMEEFKREFWLPKSETNVQLPKKTKTQDDIESLARELPQPREQLCFHYLARAKLENNLADQVLETQHVTVGMRYYEVEVGTSLISLPQGNWLKLREKTHVMQAHHDASAKDRDTHIRVPLTTSRGKAGGLNFAANYLYMFHLKDRRSKLDDAPVDGDSDTEDEEEAAKGGYGDAFEPKWRPSLFSIADARHQYQPAFMVSCLPYFFKEEDALAQKDPIRDPEVAFTQVPQFFPEIVDESDFLDNNNAMYFRINGTIRNCCGGASSCGANGTWQLNDPRDDKRRYGLEKHYFHDGKFQQGWPKKFAESYVWEVEANEHIDTWEETQKALESPGLQLKERTIFHESCKIEDTASSLNAILRGQRSQYVNMRLSYAMVKAPVSYLGAVNRWAEGAVVLMLQTYLDTPFHTRSPCASKIVNYMVLAGFPLFIVWTAFYVYLVNWDPLYVLQHHTFVSDSGMNSWLKALQQWLFGVNPLDPFGKSMNFTDFNAHGLLQDFTNSFFAEQFGYHPVVPGPSAIMLFLMFISLGWWLLGIFGCCCCSYVCSTWCYSCFRRCRYGRNNGPSPSWPHQLSAWARLLIIMDNLTYWLFFWTAFFWIFFNAYTAFFELKVGYQTKYTYLIMIILTSVFHYAQLIISMVRAQNIQRDEGNAVLEVSPDNFLRQSHLYYINAPLKLLAVINGISDYRKQKSYGVDLSYWVGGDRGDATTNIVKCWLCTMIVIAFVAVIWQFVRPRETSINFTAIVATFILVLSALDVTFPCVYLFCINSKKNYTKRAKQFHEEKEAFDAEEEALLSDAGRPRPTGFNSDGCCGLARCCRCGQSSTELPLCMRFITCSWYGKTLYSIFCENACVVGLMKWVGVIKEFFIPAALAGFTALNLWSSLGGDGAGGSIALQLVAAGFTGAH